MTFDDHWRARIAHDLAGIYMSHLQAARPQIDEALQGGDQERAVELTKAALQDAEPDVLAEFEARLLEKWQPSITH